MLVLDCATTSASSMTWLDKRNFPFCDTPNPTTPSPPPPQHPVPTTTPPSPHRHHHQCLAGEKLFEEYKTEYSTDRIEMHTGAIKPGQRVLLVDDLIATGGTLIAGINLVSESFVSRRAGGRGGGTLIASASASASA